VVPAATAKPGNAPQNAERLYRARGLDSAHIRDVVTELLED
jgi:hypothetical protein